jgi:hypothetical protein
MGGENCIPNYRSELKQNKTSLENTLVGSYQQTSNDREMEVN